MTALVPVQTSAVARQDFTRDQIEVIKDSVAQGTTDTELAFFLEVCKRTGLDPFARQVFAIKRWDARAKREVMGIQTSIDGYRLIAQRSGEYEGQQGPWWCGADGVWREVWTAPTPPAAAKVGVWRRGFREPIVGIATWTQYVQTKRDGGPTPMWERMGPHMLAKCAEALALRRAFSAETAGVYTREEMAQADVIDLPLDDDPAEHQQLLDEVEAAWQATPAELRTAELDEVLQHAGQSVAWARAVLAKVEGWSTVDEGAVDAEVVEAWSMSDTDRRRLFAALRDAGIDDDGDRHVLTLLVTQGRTESTSDLDHLDYETLLWAAKQIRAKEMQVADDPDGRYLAKPDGTAVDVPALRTFVEGRLT